MPTDYTKVTALQVVVIGHKTIKDIIPTGVKFFHC